MPHEVALSYGEGGGQAAVAGAPHRAPLMCSRRPLGYFPSTQAAAAKGAVAFWGQLRNSCLLMGLISPMVSEHSGPVAKPSFLGCA